MPDSANTQRGSRFIKDADRVVDLLDALRSGLYMREACALVGVGAATVYGAIRKGNQDLKADVDSDFADFAIKVQQAMADVEQTELGKIRAASNNPAFWAASAWFLERRYPEKYGRKDRVALEHSGDIGFAVSAKIDLSELNGDVAKALLGHASVASGTTRGAIDAGEIDFPTDDADPLPFDNSE